MAKLKGAAKAAFLRRMARGRRKAGIKNPRRKSTRRRRNPAAAAAPAVKTNPRRRKAGRRGPVRRRAKRRARRSVVQRALGVPMSLVRALLGGARKTMAKRRKRKSNPRRRRRNPGALLVNPRRRRRRNPRRVHHRRRRNPRRVHHRRRHRNPGMGDFLRGGVGAVALAAIPATLGSVAFSFIDAKFLGPYGTTVRNAAKLVFAGILGTIGRKWLGKTGSAVAMGSVLGTIGAEFGYKLAGGMVTTSAKESVGALILQAANNGEMRGELGALLDNGQGLSGNASQDFDAAMRGQISPDYAQALTSETGFGGGDDDGWGF